MHRGPDCGFRFLIWLLGSSLRGPPVSSCGVNGLLIPVQGTRGRALASFSTFVETKLRRTRAPPLRVPPGTARDRPTASPSATSLALRRNSRVLCDSAEMIARAASARPAGRCVISYCCRFRHFRFRRFRRCLMRHGHARSLNHSSESTLLLAVPPDSRPTDRDTFLHPCMLRFEPLTAARLD